MKEDTWRRESKQQGLGVHTADRRENGRRGGNDRRRWPGGPPGGVLAPRQWIRGPPRGLLTPRQWARGPPRQGPLTQTVGQGTPEVGVLTPRWCIRGPPREVLAPRWWIRGPPRGLLTPRWWVRGPPRRVSSYLDGGSRDPRGGGLLTQTVGQGTPRGLLTPRRWVRGPACAKALTPRGHHAPRAQGGLGSLTRSLVLLEEQGVRRATQSAR